jgi:nucleotide-binding universal stress UspA family protein
MTILVPVAPGRLHERVLDVAVRLGEGLDESLSVVHFVETGATQGEIQILRDQLRKRLADESVDATVAVETIASTRAKRGARVGHVLLEMVSDVDASHVVMGHSAKGFLEDIKHGSTALVMVENADVPVTIVPDADE